jgi:hypothetical protein
MDVAILLRGGTGFIARGLEVDSFDEFVKIIERQINEAPDDPILFGDIVVMPDDIEKMIEIDEEMTTTLMREGIE